MLSQLLKSNDKDIPILNELLKNSRTSFIKVSEGTQIADTTVHFRVKKMIDEKIIKRFTVELDLDKIGLKYKVLLIFKIGGHILEEMSLKRAQEFIVSLKAEKNIGFLALAEDKKTIVSLFVMENQEAFEKIIKNFQNNADINDLQIIYLNDVVKYFVDEI